jgi:cytochrome c oxidase subunit 2
VGAITACGDGGGTSGAPEPTTAAGKRGLAVVESSGCQACHTANGKSKTGPTWKDLAGSTVTLEGGERVKADDAYLAESITDPKAQVVDGYAAIMPDNSLDDEQVADVVAYLRELSTKVDASP